MDENLREQGLLGGGRKLGGSSSNSPLLTFDERMNRNKVISDIESAGFSQTSFKSSKSQVYIQTLLHVFLEMSLLFNCADKICKATDQGHI